MRAQRLRLRRMALAALPAWGLGELRLVPLTWWENATFRVETQAARYLLRLHRPGYRKPGEIDAELHILDALAAAGFPGQRAVPTPAGPRRVQATARGIPGTWDCTLLTWVEGRFLGKRVGRARLEQVGRLAGELHRWALDWQPPVGLERPRLADLGHGMARIAADHPLLDLVSEDDRALLDRGAAALHGLSAGLPSALIHLDLHLSNLLLSGGEVVAIDWDDCAWGPLLVDLAVPWKRALDVAGPGGADAVLRGYRSVCETPEDVEALLGALYRLESTGAPSWLAGHWDTPRVRVRAQSILAWVVDAVREWERGENA